MINIQKPFLIEMTKLVSLLTITIFTILFAMVPLVKKKFKLNPWIINCSQSLYCGMFLSLTFLDFFPKAMAIFEDNFQQSQTYEIFPIPFIVSLCSYTIMLILNKMLYVSRDYRSKKKHVIKDFFRHSITYNEENQQHKQINGANGQQDARKQLKNQTSEFNESQVEGKPFDIQHNQQSILQNNSSVIKKHFGQNAMKKTQNYNSFHNNSIGDYEEDQDDQAEFIEYKQKKNRPQNSKKQGQMKTTKTKTFEASVYTINDKYQDSHLSNDSDIYISKHPYQQYSQAYYILLVFSFQSFIEGVSIGVQDQFGTILLLTMATLLHKFIETSMLSVTLILHKVKYNQLAYILCFYGLVEPVAIGIGWSLSNNLVFVGFIIAFVAGNFLYVTASEGITDLFEMGDQSKIVKLVQFFILILGIAMHFFLWFAEKELKTN